MVCYVINCINLLAMSGKKLLKSAESNAHQPKNNLSFRSKNINTILSQRNLTLKQTSRNSAFSKTEKKIWSFINCSRVLTDRLNFTSPDQTYFGTSSKITLAPSHHHRPITHSIRNKIYDRIFFGVPISNDQKPIKKLWSHLLCPPPPPISQVSQMTPKHRTAVKFHKMM